MTDFLLILASYVGVGLLGFGFGGLIAVWYFKKQLNDMVSGVWNFEEEVFE